MGQISVINTKIFSITFSFMHNTFKKYISWNRPVFFSHLYMYVFSSHDKASTCILDAREWFSPLTSSHNHSWFYIIQFFLSVLFLAPFWIILYTMHDKTFRVFAIFHWGRIFSNKWANAHLHCSETLPLYTQWCYCSCSSSHYFLLFSTLYFSNVFFPNPNFF